MRYLMLTLVGTVWMASVSCFAQQTPEAYCAGEAAKVRAPACEILSVRDYREDPHIDGVSISYCKSGHYSKVWADIRGGHLWIGANQVDRTLSALNASESKTAIPPNQEANICAELPDQAGEAPPRCFSSGKGRGCYY